MDTISAKNITNSASCFKTCLALSPHVHDRGCAKTAAVSRFAGRSGFIFWVIRLCWVRGGLTHRSACWTLQLLSLAKMAHLPALFNYVDKNQDLYVKVWSFRKNNSALLLFCSLTNASPNLHSCKLYWNLSCKLIKWHSLLLKLIQFAWEGVKINHECQTSRLNDFSCSDSLTKVVVNCCWSWSPRLILLSLQRTSRTTFVKGIWMFKLLLLSAWQNGLVFRVCLPGPRNVERSKRWWRWQPKTLRGWVGQ